MPHHTDQAAPTATSPGHADPAGPTGSRPRVGGPTVPPTRTATDPLGGIGRQPWLHEAAIVLQAPTVVLSAADGQIHSEGAQGVLHADIRALSQAIVTIGGQEPTHLGGGVRTAQDARFSSIARNLGDPTPDPTVRLDRTRTVRAGVVTESLRLTSSATEPVDTVLRLHLRSDLARIERIKSGLPTSLASPRVDHEARSVHWSDVGIDVQVTADDASVESSEASDESAGTQETVFAWPVHLTTGESLTVTWRLTAHAASAPVEAAATSPWDDVTFTGDDPRLVELGRQSIADLAALLMAPSGTPEQTFLAAGAPWFFTLFGRDSIWAARLMVPFGTDLALGTLTALAARQGTRTDPDTAEQPGKIMHELRSAEAVHEGVSGTTSTMTLPPLYYGTIDATPLWICLLHDAWQWGLPDEQVRPLLPALQAALGWLSEHADSDGDGFVEYADSSGRGLANQGWKDSGDSIRFADGHIADGPVALCEVQGYAYEAAVGGAELLEHFGLDGGASWRQWAADLAVRFRDRFWVTVGDRRYPALALDGRKERVDSLTSNISHLLGTGILDADEEAVIAELLAGDDLADAFGLRTMSASDAGFSPLSYHCGSVWTHDTAIAVRGLTTAGHAAQALRLVDGLLAAATAFGHRLPELFGGDSRHNNVWPIPYPAACRPQAWAAAAIGPMIMAVTGLSVDGRSGAITVEPPAESGLGALSISGIRVRDRVVTVSVDRDGRGAIA